MDISVVTTTFNSQETILLFLKRIRNEMQTNAIKKYEIIVIDDGSFDGTRQILLKEKTKNKDLKVYFFSRNFGHHLALLEGIKFSKGSWIFMVDSDLEEDPSNFTKLLSERNQSPDIEIFETIVSQNDRPWLKRNIGHIFWLLLNYVSNRNIKINLGTTRFFSGSVRDEILKFNETYPFIPTIFRFIGFEKKFVQINKTYKGKSFYTLGKKLSLTLDAFLAEGLGFIKKLMFYNFIFSLLVFVALVSILSFHLSNSMEINLKIIVALALLLIMLSSWNLILLTILIVLRIRDELLDRPKIILDRVK